MIQTSQQGKHYTDTRKITQQEKSSIHVKHVKDHFQGKSPKMFMCLIGQILSQLKSLQIKIIFFYCNQCNKTFAQKENLNKHLCTKLSDD